MFLTSSNYPEIQASPSSLPVRPLMGILPSRNFQPKLSLGLGSEIDCLLASNPIVSPLEKVLYEKIFDFSVHILNIYNELSKANHFLKEKQEEIESLKGLLKKNNEVIKMLSNQLNDVSNNFLAQTIQLSHTNGDVKILKEQNDYLQKNGDSLQQAVYKANDIIHLYKTRENNLKLSLVKEKEFVQKLIEDNSRLNLIYNEERKNLIENQVATDCLLNQTQSQLSNALKNEVEYKLSNEKLSVQLKEKDEEIKKLKEALLQEKEKNTINNNFVLEESPNSLKFISPIETQRILNNSKRKLDYSFCGPSLGGSPIYPEENQNLVNIASFSFNQILFNNFLPSSSSHESKYNELSEKNTPKKIRRDGFLTLSPGLNPTK
ncbi:MAG: hypothetical protein JWM09_227 [Francisellaceae bacterium]|nr:hypothetical protein [Francisellaceae bacterium]